MKIQAACHLVKVCAVLDVQVLGDLVEEVEATEVRGPQAARVDFDLADGRLVQFDELLLLVARGVQKARSETKAKVCKQAGAGTQAKVWRAGATSERTLHRG